MKLIFIIISSLWLLTSCSAPPSQTNRIPEPQNITITRVVDGDTLVAEINAVQEYIRIIGIDAPEKNECFSEEATNRMQELTENKEVILESKPDEDRDNYERLLRYISVEQTDVGAILIMEGYVRSFPWFPHPRSEAYNSLERQAKEGKRGLWSACEKLKGYN